ncbi:MAG: heme NO-binding domain-containing protein [Marinibacterium sp.]
MHGLINRAIQSFVTSTYGAACWQKVAQDADLGFVDFEAMLVYDDALTLDVLNVLGQELGRDQTELLEDLGTYLVSHPKVEALRRLLRFGGVTYEEFLHSLDDLPDRTRLAVSDLHLPALELWEDGGGRFQLKCAPGLPGFSHVMIGILRAMADDYGALVFLEHEGATEGGDVIGIQLIEADFAEGRDFDLGARAP